MGVGVVAGLAGAVLVTRFVESLLFGVRPFDPLTYAGVAGLLGLVAIIASAVPARRAARVDPVRILKDE